MEIYLVGGAVRDHLLGRSVKERDWVVVGGTPEQLLAEGFQQVGKDFPVFLHPETHEEYALARRERKVGVGYTGFTCDASRSVTLEEDLMRRDLTINAMAQTVEGRLIDPYGGERDLKLKRLRHVSSAFVEDPLRVLRVARFAARYYERGFQVAPETMALMTTMVKVGELAYLTPERVWQEISRALMEDKPSIFFAVLHQCGALKELCPELAKLFENQGSHWESEINRGVHTLMAVDEAAIRGRDLSVRFAVLCYNLDEGLAMKKDLSTLSPHKTRGDCEVKSLAQRWRIPRDMRELALLVACYHEYIYGLRALKAEVLLKTLERVDAFRRPERFGRLLLACEVYSLDHEVPDYMEGSLWLEAFTVASTVSIQSFVEKGLQGEDIAQALREERIRLLREWQIKWANS